jgi:polyisoprenoid-binding protein YceI
MRSWGWKRWLLTASVAAVIAVVGGTWVYIHVIQGDAPAALTVADALPTALGGSPSSTNVSADPSGAWNVANGSKVGYRVNEVLFGQTHEAVGRTEDVTGTMKVEGTTITQATFTADMTTVTSDDSRRDGQFNGRIMETSTYPTATFELTEPIELGRIPDEGTEATYSATGNLTLHGVTKSVTFDVTGLWSGSTIQIAGSIAITFGDYHIADPSFAGLVSTEDHGALEFALNLER